MAGSEFQVNQDLTEFSQTWAGVAAATNGRFLTVFQSVDELYFRIVDRDGRMLQKPLAVTDSDFDPGSYSAPVVVARPAAAAAVLYTHQATDAEFEVGYAIVDKYGILTARGTLFEDLDHYRGPVGAALADGRTLVVAKHYLQGADNKGDLAFDILNAKGTSGSGGKILALGTGNLDTPAIASFKNKALLVYTDTSGDLPVLVGRYFDGQDFGSPIKITGKGSPDDASVAALPDGRFVVVWNSEDTDAIQAQFVSADGHNAGPVLTLANVGGLNYHTAVAALPHGGFMVVWENDGGVFHPEVEGSHAILAQQFDRDGKPVDHAFMVNLGDPLTDQNRPSIAVDMETGYAFIAWEDQHAYEGPVEDAFPSGIRGLIYEVWDRVTIGEKTNDKLVGQGDAEHINGRGGHDKLWGMGADDLLVGHNGDDALRGGLGDDHLRGGNGDDLMKGGRGDDYLVGGMGRDVFVGGRGKDVFDFDAVEESRPGAGRDVIRDFAKGDLIDLSGLRPGHRPLDYIGGEAFHGQSGEVRYARGLVQVDKDGDGRTDLEILVDLGTGHRSDFVL